MNIPREYLTHGLVAAASLAVGGGVSFLITKRVLETKYEEIIAEEVAAARDHYKRIYKVGEYASVLSVRESETEDNAESELPTDVSQYRTETQEQPSDLKITTEKIKQAIEENRNVFTNAKEINELDEEEIQDRNPEVPYIITEHEFRENELDHEQITLSYFEEDDVLADENDGVIEDSDMVVGDDNLSRFGHGSGNHNILFVRNERMGTDFEIAKSNGSYAREVLGFIQHDEDPRTRIRRFRGDDE